MHTLINIRNKPYICICIYTHQNTTKDLHFASRLCSISRAGMGLSLPAPVQVRVLKKLNFTIEKGQAATCLNPISFVLFEFIGFKTQGVHRI